ncbi:MAG TPA: ABC transporter permease, partial [Flavipsychrobacter sp.]|nr:ABC transporter permease [Flavipsychrobacter sp.]
MNRTLVWHLALRYVRGKRSANVVPILSRISMVAIAVGSGAMIILFSVFNGFASLVKDLYIAFYPEVKVSVVKGKFFSLDDSQLNSIKHLQGVQNMAIVIEDNVLANNDPNEQIVTVKGIDSNYYKVNTIRSYINLGRDSVTSFPLPTAIVGQHIANTLGLDVDNAFSRITLYYLNNSSVSSAVDVASATRSLTLKPDGTFRVNDEFDSKFVLAPLSLVQSFFNQNSKYSSIELKLVHGTNPLMVKSKIQKLLGGAYKVQTRYEQNETIYSVMSTEKWVVYAVLVLVLIIA